LTGCASTVDLEKSEVAVEDSPAYLQAMAERVCSYLGGYRVVDMRTPDYAVKVGMLKQRAVSEGVQLPEDVCDFIAGRTSSNLRETQGAFFRLTTEASITGLPISIDLARQALRYLGNKDANRVRIEDVLRKRGGFSSATT
jgi:chromosomal replication initiator protein